MKFKKGTKISLMEAKLKEYRALRRRKELIENTKEALQQTKDKVVDFIVPKIIQNMGKIREEEIVLVGTCFH